jgi:hypothetical protein
MNYENLTYAELMNLLKNTPEDYDKSKILEELRKRDEALAVSNSRSSEGNYKAKIQ